MKDDIFKCVININFTSIDTEMSQNICWIMCHFTPPVSQSPWIFFLSGDKNSYEYPDGGFGVYFLVIKFSSGDEIKVNFQVGLKFQGIFPPEKKLF